MQDDDNLKILSDRITELSNKSTLILLFLSFAMVSATTLQMFLCCMIWSSH